MTASALVQPNGNIIIGGNFDTNPFQSGATFVATANNTYIADQFIWAQSGAGVVTCAKTADAPTASQAGIFTQNCLHVDVTTADAALAAGDLYAMQTRIEGYNFLQIAQNTFVLPFWHKHTKTGVYCVGFANSVSDRSYVAEYTQAVADTWEFAYVTVTASPSAGTWDYTNGIGLQVTWSLAMGANFITTAGTWQAGQFYATANQVNAMDNVANNFKIQLIGCNPGNQPWGWRYRSWQEEQLLCQRYFWKSFAQGTAPAQNIGFGTGELYFIATGAGAVSNASGTNLLPTTMRLTLPTMTLYNPAAANAQIRDETLGGDFTGSAAYGLSSNQIAVIGTGNAATAVGNICGVHVTVNARF